MRLSFLIVAVLVLILVPWVALAANPPTVETFPASDNCSVYCLSNIVTVSANITSIGGGNINVRGFVYDSLQHGLPGKNDELDKTDYTLWIYSTGNWTGGGEYSANLTHLEPDTTYFFRAGVINDKLDSGYGEEQYFTTIAEIEEEEDIGEVANELANLNALISEIITLLLVVVVIAFVIGRGGIIPYAVGAPLCIVYGLSLAKPDAELSVWMVGVVIAIIGTYFLYQIPAIAFDWYKRRRKG